MPNRHNIVSRLDTMEEIKPREFSDIWAFVRVVDTGSFSEAARQMGTTKASISKQVARLERALATKLLNRSTRRIGLTEAGREIHQHAIRMVEEAKAIEATIAGLQQGPSGTLRVTTSMAFGNTQLARLLPEFMARYPDITVVMNLNDRSVDLVEEGFDVAVRLTAQVDLQTAVARQVGLLRHVLVATPAYLARHGRPQAIADLGKHHCLVFGDSRSGATWTFTVDGERAQVRVGAALAANSSQSLRMAMLGGAGIALLPTYIAGDDIAAGRAERLLPATQPLGQFGDRLYAIYLQDRFLPPKVRVFIDYLLEKIGDHPDWDAFLDR
jgi:DNA-binding transcriptional LysR family regulator